MRFSRNLILVFLLALAVFGSAFDSQSALTSQMTDIDSLFKKIEAKTAQLPQFTFNDPDIQAALAKMKKLASDLESASAQGPSDTITDVSAHYLTALGEAHVLYAKSAHIPGVWSSRFDFETLAPYRLRLHAEAARALVLQKPFNARHLDSDRIEFFVTSQEKQMAEFLALDALTDGYAYEKLIQFATVREGFTNLWGLQRLNYSPISVQKVPTCSPDLLSFRVANGDVRSSEAYQELIALDRYNLLTTKLSEAYQISRAFTMAPSTEYYGVLTKLFSTTPEFKTYIAGVPPTQVSAWLRSAADQISNVETVDWQNDAENAKKIMGASTLIGDSISSQTTATRIAQAIARRHADAAAAEILKIATDNLKIKASPELTQRIRAALASYEAGSAQGMAPKLAPSLKDLDSVSDAQKQVYDRIQAKIAETTPLAERLMPAVHDLQLISMAGAVTDDPQEAEASHRTKAPLAYVRPSFQYVITDTAMFKAHFMSRLEQSSSIYKKLKGNSALMARIAQFLLGLDKAVSARLEQLAEAKSPISPVSAVSDDQLSRELLSAAQTQAQGLISSLAADPASAALVKQAFDTIHLLSARNPTDLAPTTQAQRELVEMAIDQGYTQNPLLGVRWKRSGFLQVSSTLLEYIHDEVWKDQRPGAHFQSGTLTRLVLEAIQNATNDRNGKLEDFCQADLHDPKHDQRFRNMFLSATHLRQTLTHGEDADHSAALKKFDDDLTRQTETRQEAIMNRFVNPWLNWVFVLTIVMLIIMVAFPVTAPVMVTLLAVVNYMVMAPLSAASLYLRLSVGFYEQPSQLKYQDALASTQISAKDPFDDWEQLKKIGLLSNATDRVSVEKSARTIHNSQLMTIAMLPMDIWYGESIVSGVRSNVGITGMIKLKQLFNGEIPTFAEKPSLPKVPSFRSLIKDEGAFQATKTKAVDMADKTKILIGLKPVFGMFTSQEASLALRTALSRSMPQEARSLLPEIQLYRDFLAQRLQATGAMTEIALGNGSTPATLQIPATVDELPDFLARGLRSNDAIAEARRFWSETPELKGRLTINEAMENSSLRKFELLPKSLYQAIRERRFGEWVKNYGNVTKMINKLRGQFVAQKLESFTAFAAKISQLVERGSDCEQILANLSDDELLLLEETARGPQWLAYGYWNAKWAAMKLADSPLKGLLGVFDTYHEMIRSVRPYDWAPQGKTANNASSPANDRDDLRRFYERARAQDGMEIQPQAGGAPVQKFDNSKTILIEQKIEEQLYDSNSSGH